MIGVINNNQDNGIIILLAINKIDAVNINPGDTTNTIIYVARENTPTICIVDFVRINVIHINNATACNDTTANITCITVSREFNTAVSNFVDGTCIDVSRTDNNTTRDNTTRTID